MSAHQLALSPSLGEAPTRWKLVSSSPRRVDGIFIGILAVGVAVRVICALPSHVAYADESYYVWLARSLFSGGGFTYYAGHPEVHFTPLFPIVLGVLHWIAGDWFVVTRVAYVIFSSLLPLPVFRLAREMYGRRVALIAASLAALLPALTVGVLFAESLSEPLYLFCLFAAVERAYAAWRSGRAAPFFGAGVLFSLAYLTRPEGLVHFLAAGAFLLSVTIFRPGARMAWLARTAGFAGAFLAVAAPYVIYLHHHTGAWTFTTKSTTSYVTTRALVDGNNVQFMLDTDGLDENGEVLFHAMGKEQGVLGLLLGPYRHRVTSDVAKNFSATRVIVMKASFFGRWLFLTAVFGLLARPWSRRRTLDEIFNATIACALASVFLFFIKERLLYAWLLPLTLWAALGLDIVLSWFEQSHLPGPLGKPELRRGLQAAFLALVTAWLLHISVFEFRYASAQRNHTWPAVMWLREHLPPDSVVIANGGEAAFHAGMRWLPLPVSSREKVVEYGKAHGATHVCILGRNMASRPDQAKDLFENARSTDDLMLLVKVEDPAADASFAVYRIGGGAGEP